MEVPPLTVEMFVDEDSPYINKRDAIEGYSHVKRILRGLEMVRMTRLIILSTSYDGLLDASELKNIDLPADLNIVLTKKPLPCTVNSDVINDGSAIVGIAQNEGEVDSLRLAVVNVNHGITKRTVQHELGHLLGLKRYGTTSDNLGHCKVSDCVMHYKDQPYYPIERVKSEERTRILRRPIYYEERLPLKSSAERFCLECCHQLLTNTRMLTLAKSGEDIPPDLLC